MEILCWIGLGAFFVSSLAIGIRLLQLARRTAQIPELLIGSSFVAVFVGSSIHAVVRAATGGSVMELPVASLIISVCGLTATCCMWMAFHPPSALTGRRKGDAVPSATD